MAVTNYHTVNGEIIGETTSGARIGYLTDGLGSVTATQNSAGTTLATYRYKPYGSLLAKTGGGVDPAFLWVGTFGYRGTGMTHATTYVRARTFAIALGRWTSVDEIWPHEPAFRYGDSNPTSKVDVSGRQAGWHGVWARTPSHSKYYGVQAWVQLPDGCAVPKVTGKYIDAYLALRRIKGGKVETLWDCGVSFSRARENCWLAFLNPAQKAHPRMKTIPCPGCGRNARVHVKLEMNTTARTVSCWVNHQLVGTDRDAYDHEPVVYAQPWQIQHAIGALDNTLSHTPIYWFPLDVKTSRTSGYTPLADPVLPADCRPDYCATGILSDYPLAAYLHGGSMEGCDCPVKTGVNPID